MTTFQFVTEGQSSGIVLLLTFLGRRNEAGVPGRVVGRCLTAVSVVDEVFETLAPHAGSLRVAAKRERGSSQRR